MCNLRCNYCYISNCADDPHSRKPTYDYPLETMIKAFNPKSTICLYKQEIEKYNVSYDDLFKPLYDIKTQTMHILNYFENKEFKEFDFSDPTHLLPTGAIKLTKLIVEDISRI